MVEIVVDLDEFGVRALVDELKARRDHLTRGKPLPGNDRHNLGAKCLSYVMWEIEQQLGWGHMHGAQPPNPYLSAMRGPIVLALRLDAATAADLWHALYDTGEHIAAGAPVGRARAEVEARLDALLTSLEQRPGASGN